MLTFLKRIVSLVFLSLIDPIFVLFFFLFLVSQFSLSDFDVVKIIQVNFDRLLRDDYLSLLWNCLLTATVLNRTISHLVAGLRTKLCGVIIVTTVMWHILF